MSRHSTEISVPARHTELGPLLAALAGNAEAAGVAQLPIHRLQLAVEELFTNTLSHGFGGESDLPVTIVLEAEPSGALLRYIDRAPPFDLAAAEVLPHDPNRTGGFGLNMVRAMAVATRYRREDGANVTEFDFAF